MKIAIIGAGAMGGALAHGLLKSDVLLPAQLTVANPHDDKLEPFAKAGAQVTSDNRAAATDADIVVLAVKPWLVATVIDEIKDTLDYDRQIVVDMAAGIPAADQLQMLGKDGRYPALFLAMPNIAIAERASMTFISTPNATPQQADTVVQLFGSLGTAMLVEERQLAAGTMLSGCGIAFALRYIRAASEGGVQLGFKADQAKAIVAQTLQGATALIEATGKHPEALIDQVTTPGGMTIRGLNAMEKAGFTHAVIAGLLAK